MKKGLEIMKTVKSSHIAMSRTYNAKINKTTQDKVAFVKDRHFKNKKSLFGIHIKNSNTQSNSSALLESYPRHLSCEQIGLLGMTHRMELQDTHYLHGELYIIKKKHTFKCNKLNKYYDNTNK